jgi:excisionase family DNA binding protein
VEQLLTIRSFADVLGISEKTARRLVWTGRIPCVRIGRVVRLDPADVSRFVAARKE